MKKRTLEWIFLAVVILCIWLVNMVLPNLDLSESLYQGIKRGLGGVCGAATGLWVFYRDGRKRWEKAGPQERREMEIREKDERSQLIREKAAVPGQIAVAVIFLCQMAAYTGRCFWLNKRM